MKIKIEKYNNINRYNNYNNKLWKVLYQKGEKC